MKKLLIITGSPRRRGNTSILCDEFARGAAEAGHTVERIDAARLNIKGCLGCNVCLQNNGNCVQNDDIKIIRDKMVSADVIVLASPIYFYTMPAQLKALIDRTYNFYQELAGKEFYYIITCAGPGMEYTETMISALRGFTCCIPDAKESGTLCATGLNNIGEVRDMPEFIKAYEMGRSL